MRLGEGAGDESTGSGNGRSEAGIARVRPDDVDADRLRKMILGSLRYGKPFVIDMLSLALDREAFDEMLEPVLPGLFNLLTSREILREENYSQLIKESDDDDYTLKHWRERTTEHFHFIVFSKLPAPPEWCKDTFFMLKVAA